MVEGEEGWKLEGMGSPGRRRMGLDSAIERGRRRKRLGVCRVDGTKAALTENVWWMMVQQSIHIARHPRIIAISWQFLAYLRDALTYPSGAATEQQLGIKDQCKH